MGKKDPKPRLNRSLLGVRTLEFQLNIGVVRGYGHDNKDGPISPAAKVAEDWQEIAEELFREYKVYPAGVVTPGVTLYPSQYGCPRGGEVTVTVTGLANPEHLLVVKDEAAGYSTDLDMWRYVVAQAAERLRKKLEQTTAYLTFRKVRFTYLKDEIPF